MSNNPINEGVNKPESNDEMRSLNGQELVGIRSARRGQNTTVTSEETAWRIRVVTDP